MSSGAHEQEHHLVPIKTYVLVWIALIFFTVVTVAAAYADMKQMAIFTCLLIACAKSTLVVLYFMHMRYEPRVLTWFFIAGFGTYVIFVALTFADYYYR